MSKINASDYSFNGTGGFEIKNSKTSVPSFYEDKKDFKKQLKSLQKDIDKLQEMMYAHNKWGILAVFQAMDAAGKDSTMREVFKRVHPLGTSFYSFKRPSEEELDHDYLWRCMKQLPERGKIKVFNRSYYEEVLVVKVHESILHQGQRIPAELRGDDVWEKRYQDIVNFENYLQNNGIVVVKFFLNVSKEEQGRRLIDRINEADKNWKFEEGDIKERGYWNDYQQAYEDLINATSTERSPWHIIPADDKKNMRLIVAQTIKEALEALPMSYPEADEARQVELKRFIEIIEGQNIS
ncbi:PPK2 family polyphosphate kinase [Jiulongibacter sediminis]|uniref:Phosphate:nucleotide phosphotransferase n=1 Tax=Jiulongibacter sediminis TaxID=1605367 RepID=A0A0P7BUG5_9BACT|nr:PPK2 family polyphosphate kinase [Jiulongibacter sediminis]KPM48410.1 phosphate:nucleotide phosphotransferase [Jiulongibacter sediminis]TBX24950.1 phosphate:nucleotide phosphotransferase [Jiulongibacter sediminis]